MLTGATQMSDREPSINAARKCSEWLKWCRDNGWPASSTPRLCDLWWEFHDDNGKLVEPTGASEAGVK